MGPRALLAMLLALAAPAGVARAQPVVASAGPESVAVTVYRAPDRGSDDALDLAWLRGYALVTETRTVTIPAGRATIRFEGVAGGMLPKSAIVSGLPDGVREKNLDADLLAPYSLYARSLGRPVTLRRRLASGTVEEPAILRSGPDGGAILQTRDGFVAANCGPGSESVLFPQVPAGLTPKPTLSVQTDSTAERRVTLTLSYLAWGFDWQANYVATLRPDGRTADLFAWVTLANGDVTSFADAQTMVVAGHVNRTDRAPGSSEREAPPLVLKCFFHPAVMPVAAPLAPAYEDGDIVVTGIRASLANSVSIKRNSDSVVAIQEELGDLKLYRVPMATTIGAKSQKQVTMLDRHAVPVTIFYRNRLGAGVADDTRIMLRAQNRKERGLGLPLPAGPVAVFQPSGDARLLVGEGSIGDKAVNEEVEIDVAGATQVAARIEREVREGRFRLTVTNALPTPIHYEAEFTELNASERVRANGLRRRNGHDVWITEIPANGTATLRYTVTDAGAKD